MLVPVKGQCKRLYFFPACAMGRDIAFDQLGVGDYVHACLSFWRLHACDMETHCAAGLNLRAVYNLQKFLDGLFVER